MFVKLCISLRLAIPSNNASLLRDLLVPRHPLLVATVLQAGYYIADACVFAGGGNNKTCARIRAARAHRPWGNHHDLHRAPYIKHLDGITDSGFIGSTRKGLPGVGTHYLLRFAGYQPYPSGYVVISCRRNG